MEDLNTTRVRQHKMVLTDRGICNITGVCDVLSFDVAEVLLETEQGMLMINGKIDSLTYSENTGYGGKGESLFSRLFK